MRAGAGVGVLVDFEGLIVFFAALAAVFRGRAGRLAAFFAGLAEGFLTGMGSIVAGLRWGEGRFAFRRQRGAGPPYPLTGWNFASI